LLKEAGERPSFPGMRTSSPPRRASFLDTCGSELLLSELAEDEDFRDTVAIFVASLLERMTTLAEAKERGDWGTVRVVAHQLRGAGGSFGYPSITEIAAQLEREVAGDTIADVAKTNALALDLADLCQRAAEGMRAFSAG
jgi:HPt (histidine-containing phosphotransfer) domain-containing protein